MCRVCCPVTPKVWCCVAVMFLQAEPALEGRSVRRRLSATPERPPAHWFSFQIVSFEFGFLHVKYYTINKQRTGSSVISGVGCDCPGADQTRPPIFFQWELPQVPP